MEIAKREEDMDALFKQFDEDQDGELSAKEFDKLLKHLGLNNKHSKVQRERVVRHITKQPKEANITHHDFVAALKGSFLDRAINRCSAQLLDW
jgi:Ca2+-binding EF-hand superfamily protein